MYEKVKNLMKVLLKRFRTVKKGDTLESGEVFVKLVHIATSYGVTVKFAPLKCYDGRIKNNRVAIRQDLPSIEEFNYNLAHEIAHYFLHCDKGDVIDCDKKVEYEEQADRAAKMLLVALYAK